MNPPFPASPKASEKTMTTHRTASSPMAKKFCMIIPSTFLPRTMPA